MTLEQVMQGWAKMRDVPDIIPMLEKKSFSKSWAITLTEVWPDDTILRGHSPLDSRVDWVTEELKKWQGVRRMAWDQWYFDDKRHAQKFITLYNLIWS